MRGKGQGVKAKAEGLSDGAGADRKFGARRPQAQHARVDGTGHGTGDESVSSNLRVWFYSELIGGLGALPLSARRRGPYFGRIREFLHPTWNSFRACDKPARPRLAPKVGIWGLDRGGKPSVYDYGYP